MRKFAAAYRLLAALGGMTVAWLLLPAIALADNCSSEADCLQTGGYNAGIAIGGGLIGLGAVLLGNWIGGTWDWSWPWQATGGQAGGAQPPIATAGVSPFGQPDDVMDIGEVVRGLDPDGATATATGSTERDVGAAAAEAAAGAGPTTGPVDATGPTTEPADATGPTTEPAMARGPTPSHRRTRPIRPVRVRAPAQARGQGPGPVQVQAPDPEPVPGHPFRPLPPRSKTW